MSSFSSTFDDTMKSGKIAGIVMGCVIGCVVLTVIVVMIVCCCRGARRQNTVNVATTTLVNPNNNSNNNNIDYTPQSGQGNYYNYGGPGNNMSNSTGMAGGQLSYQPMQENTALPPPANPLYYGALPLPGGSQQPYGTDPYVASAPVQSYAYGAPPPTVSTGAWGVTPLMTAPPTSGQLAPEPLGEHYYRSRGVRGAGNAADDDVRSDSTRTSDGATEAVVIKDVSKSPF